MKSCLAVLSLLVAMSCAPITPPAPPDRTAEFTRTCSDIYVEELGRTIDPSGLGSCLEGARRGMTRAQLAQGLHDSPEGVAYRDHLAHPHVDPSTISLEDLAAIRGAMWPLGPVPGIDLPFGPRPGQSDNVIATVFITDYTDAQQNAIIAELKARGYTHVVMGPLVDSDGYHGLWPPNDWRGANFERFLDALQKFWDAGLKPVVFLHPDNWTFERTRDELTPLLQQPRAQQLIRIIVPAGWEPARYEWSNATWVLYAKWGRETLPNALNLLHTVTDVDAPVGTDARGDDNGMPNAQGWIKIVPYLHGWLTQSAAFDDPTAHGDTNHPEKTNFDNWQDNFRCAVSYSYCNRFHHGYAGWPTTSAWGDAPIRIYAGEYSAYWKFWRHRTEAEGVTWGDAAAAAGADGYLDSGSVAVPVRR